MVRTSLSVSFECSNAGRHGKKTEQWSPLGATEHSDQAKKDGCALLSKPLHSFVQLHFLKGCERKQEKEKYTVSSPKEPFEQRGRQVSDRNLLKDSSLAKTNQEDKKVN